MTYNDWLGLDARYLLNQIPKNVVEWVHEEYMTDEEKAAHPTYETTGGYLRVLDESESAQIWTLKFLKNAPALKSGRLTSDRTGKGRSGTNRVPETVERKEGEEA